LSKSLPAYAHLVADSDL